MNSKAIGAVALAAGALGLGLVPVADAASVRMDGGTFRYEAAAGERNHVTITRTSAGFDVQDATRTADATADVPLTAMGTECAVVAAGRAVCAAGPGAAARIETGDDVDWVRTVNTGAAQAYSIAGGTGDDQLQGADGADLIEAGTGLDSVQGNAGDDVVLPGPDAVRDTVDFGTGADTVSYAGSAHDMHVTLGEYGEGEIPGVEEEDTLFSVESGLGGDGDDTFVGTAAADHIEGGPGADTLIGLAGADDLRGQAGDDTLDGGADRDSLDGRDGADTLLGGAAADNHYGGAGDDVLDGGADSDNVHGDGGDDTLLGGDGNDYLSAGPGVNLLDGGAGSDDMLAWGGPTDTVTYASRSAAVSVTVTDTTTLLPPRNDGEAGEGDNVIGAETVIGGAGDDAITGTAAANTLVGGAGDDALAGGDGGDKLDGGDGSDVLGGGAGDDALTGGLGADAFAGGSGADAFAARDGVAEDIACGDGTDSVVADPRDRPAKDCEAVARGPR